MRKTVSGIMLTLLLMSMLTLAFNIQPVKASGTIYIRADGSVDPSTAPIATADNVTYMFTDNINDSIVIERDNIVVDGAGYTLQGTGGGTGIDLTGRRNVTIENMEIKGFKWGTFLFTSSSNNTISGNKFSSNSYGIYFYDSQSPFPPFSSNNTVSGNELTGNSYGIYIRSASNNVLRSNNMTNNQYNLDVGGVERGQVFFHDIDTSNTVDGKPVYYWVNKQDMTVPLDAGYVGLVNSTRMTVQNLALTKNGQGILLALTTNSTITENNITNNAVGIQLTFSAIPWYSRYRGIANSVFGNNITNNGFGISGYYANNTVSGNLITNNLGDGISGLDGVIDGNNITNNVGVGISGSYGIISGNNITNNSGGIRNAQGNISSNNITNNSYGIWGVSSSTISGNNITNNSWGIMLPGSNYNTISGNNITNNSYGIGIASSSYNTISGNNITNNSYGIVIGTPNIASKYNSIVRNNITANNYFGISIGMGSSNNSVNGNTIANNGEGVVVAGGPSYNSIVENNITANIQYGIRLDGSSNSILRNNTITNSRYNLNINGSSLSNFINDIDTSNTVDGKSVYYWINRQNMTVPLDAGYVGLVSSTQITVENLTLTKNGQGILLAYTTNSTLENNTITDNFQGICLKTSSNNTISGNDLTVNSRGIEFWDSINNNITENDIKNNEYGIRLEVSSNNSIYHNSFITNTNQVYVSSGYADVWDDDYPSGGNYWSDYTGVDIMHGPNQNQHGSDGIGDTPYTIDANNRDRYPLMKPYGGPHDIGIINVTTSKTGCLPMPTVGQGCNATINIIVFNYGNNTETFNVTVYANITSIATQTVTLTSRNSTTITFPWNTTGFAKGNYTMSAYATPVPGEIDTADNNLVDGLIKVTVIGDINGDFKVDIKDLVLVIKHFGSYPGSIKPWNPNADINSDNKVDIKDLVLVIKHFGEHYP